MDLLKALRWISYLLVAVFFLSFQTCNINRYLKQAEQGGYSKSIMTFIGLRDERTRFLIFERNSRKIGYSILKVEHVSSEPISVKEPEAKYRVTVTSQAELFPWLGKTGGIKLHAEILFDALCEALSVEGEFQVAGAALKLRGKKDGKHLLLHIITPVKDLSFRLPRNIGLGGTLLPIPPLGDLAVGEKKSIPYFDPITRKHAECRIEVLKTKQLAFYEMKLKAYVIRAELPIGTFTITASPDGEIFEASGRDGITFRRSSQMEVNRFFDD